MAGPSGPAFLFNFYPRSPCGERRMGVTVLGIQHNFYPRSPCGERRGVLSSCSAKIIFLSTLSLRRATPHCYQQTAYLFYFYPRSPCGERRSGLARLAPRLDFYPRSPCGERPMGVTVLGIQHHFYPRSPCGERLTPARMSSRLLAISIHALLAESDGSGLARLAPRLDFYPRSPCGERPC